MEPDQPTGTGAPRGAEPERSRGVDPATAAVFGRPAGVHGPFGDGPADTPEFRPSVPDRDPVLAEAFGTDADGGLPIGHDRPAPTRPAEPAPTDPWRDPEAAATAGPPAGTDAHAPPPAPGPALGVREVLFGRAVAPRALAVLAVLALAVGVVGGLIGRVTAETTSKLTSSTVKLITGSGDGEGEISRVVEVASAVQPAVVSVEAATDRSISTGSGVVIDGEGYIVTNNHVISEAAQNPDEAEVSVTFDDGQNVPARIVGRDMKTDLAVLKVDDVENLTVARLGDADAIRVGEDAVAFGSPMGLSRTVTRGIVSAKHRPVALQGLGSDPDTVIDAVQTDAAINSGNSGGPLINAAGEVIGINTAIFSTSGGSVGLGFAVPVDTVAAVAGQLIAEGRMQHPEIGVNARTVANERITGAEIANVIEGGPAQAGGLLEGDVVVRVGDRKVTDADELVVAVRALPAGQPATIEVVRSGQRIELQITPELE